MKKRGILALLLACSFAFGSASMTACNVIDGSGTGTNQEQGDGTTVAVSGVSLNKPALSLKVGGNETLTATVSPDDATDRSVTWSSDNTAVADVDQTGKVTAKAAGTAHITVTTVSGSKTASCTVTVSENDPVVVHVTDVTLNKPSLTLTVGGSEKLTETVAPAGATNTNVSWSSSDSSVASVSDGVVTANKAGTAVITVTTEDGSHTAQCSVTVNPATAATVHVTGVTVSPTSANVNKGGQKQLTKTIAPANASNQNVTWSSGNTAVATVDQTGKVTAKAAGSATITVKTADGNFSASCVITVPEDAPEPVVDAKITYNYAGNECAAFEWADTNAANAKVEYKLASESSYTALSGDDKAYLVRQKDTATARVDLVGLKGGAVYDFKITTSAKEVLTAEDVTIHAHDRSGYAHFKYSSGVGGYKDDGTVKSNAKIIYLTEENKNNIDGKGTSIAEYLSSFKDKDTNSTPIVVRVIGTVGAATWNKLEENGGKELTPDKVVGINGEKLTDFYNIDRSTYNSSTKKYEGGTTTNIYQQSLIADGFNTLNYYPSVYGGKRCDELVGLSSRIKYDSSKDEFDSCWNDCSIQNVENVTIEGIGEDACIFQWGMTFKNCSSIEVRNIRFDDYTEDACSFEGSETSVSSLSEFKKGNIWLHHNTFEEGLNYWDVCNEQDKHDGDGSTDFKGLKNITISYNHYIETHKTGLIGGGDGHTTANVTFHHNYYESCNQRMPLGRQANMHMYNNYYSGSTMYSISLRAGAYAFIENCYFTEDTSKHYPLELKTGSNGTPAAKIVNCYIDETKIINGSGADYIYVGDDRYANLKSTDNKFVKNGFDTNSSVFYYDGVKSDVSVMFTAQETHDYVPSLAGVQKRDGDVTLGGAGNGNDYHQHTYSEDYTSAGVGGHYHMANCEHTTEHTALEPHVYDNAEDTTCNNCGFVRTVGGEAMTAFTVNGSSVSGVGTSDTLIETDIAIDDKGVMSLISGTTWKIYSNTYLQAIPAPDVDTEIITIDLTQYSGAVKLTVKARQASTSNTNRYYRIDGNGESLKSSGYGTSAGLTTAGASDEFTLQCGYKYTLITHGGLRFESFAFVPLD
ncbi:MAG: Ig-like domain-containing protein [Clostridiales bacterium]|nr:Ig-like domain-containing protein [Clostridiales bacterium]